MMTPIVSVSIVNWNTKDELKSCLDSLRGCEMEIETVVCDNASHDGSAEMVRQCFPGAVLIESGQNLGFGSGNNRCFSECHSDYILISNPDILFNKDGILEMLKTFRDDETVGAVGPQLLNTDGSVQKHFYRKFPTVMQVLFYHTILKAIFLRWRWFRYRLWEDNTDASNAIEVDQPPGACLMVRRKILEELKGFDGRFELFFEDVDLCRRIRNLNFKIIMNPNAKFIHFGNRGLEKELPAKLKALYYQSGALYFRLHNGKLQSLIYKILYLVNEAAKVIIRTFLLIFMRARRRTLLGNLIDSINFIRNVAAGKTIHLE